MTLLRELIDVPEHVQKGDFVLRLSEGVVDPARTLAEYVVTPELVRCFDQALDFIRDAVLRRTSKATYLHGSFGSGKSHFMAVLHLILSGNPQARGIPELAGIIAKHNAWLQGKKFLLVPYHMIGAHGMESGVFGGYVDFIRRTHPGAPVPGVFLAEKLFDDARRLRQRMGDRPFFDGLNAAPAGGGAGTGWGELESAWDAGRFESAMEADPGSEERTRLVSDLVGTYFGSYSVQAEGQREAYLSMDKGLCVLSQHARDLGYHALLLFLDELILWLATRSVDLDFVKREAAKLTNLVEAQTPDRPIPIVSFVARQRDLRKLIGDHVAGAERLNFSDSLDWQEGRFNTITLEDRNLPLIAEKRVLKPRSEAARGELDAAFERTAKVREAVWNTLLTSEGDRQMFRRVYPFSPALVQTLIAVSSVLQRERTALKVMMQLLVDQRDTLRVGDLVPVGDLFDVVAHGDEAFSAEMAIHFENAKRLYHHKLLPVLEKQHGRVEELEQLPWDEPRRVAFRNDDRLVKTLLLSALVPGVESLRGLTAERLAALNHGTIKTPIPGREAQEVLRRVKGWAASVGEVRVGEGTNPTIAVQLTGVDIEPILAKARGEDSSGNRKRRIRRMLFEQFGVDDTDQLFLTWPFRWRNTDRSCEIIFGNIRDANQLADVSLEASDTWKVVIDFPFDEPGHRPRDDLGRLQQFRQSHPHGTRTLAWVPNFFSQDALEDLGLLVVLEHVLTGERFAGYASELSPQDRLAAKTLLENQCGQLRQRVRYHLEAGYGLDAVLPDSLDRTQDLDRYEQFQSLKNGFDPQPPAAVNLRGALEGLLDQALTDDYPAHPKFEAEVRKRNLEKVYEVVSEAAQREDGRVEVEKALRPLVRHIANPLLLGEMGADATHFVLGQHWKNHFTRKAMQTGSALTVGQLREWIDDPKPMGLPTEAANLVILTFAEQTNRSFYEHGGPQDGSLVRLPDHFELREQRLPDEAGWSLAVQRANSFFGITVSPLRKAGNVSSLTSQAKGKVGEHRAGCQAYARRLKERLDRLGITGAPRLKTAQAVQALVDKLHAAEGDAVVSALASAEVATSEAAMGTALVNAGDLAATLDAFNWEILDAVGRLTDERREGAAEVGRIVREALAADEQAVPLAPALKEAQSKAVRLLTAQSS
ncbi:MAG TPA: phage resistance protein, partial [Gemmataceae bacterium]|nr:phage resistance protein [Gemmataceae bacterium]